MADGDPVDPNAATVVDPAAAAANAADPAAAGGKVDPGDGGAGEAEVYDGVVSMRYRKKPIVIEAFQFHRAIGACADNAPIWFIQAEHEGKVRVWSDDEVPYCMIETLEGRMKAENGDWIIKGVKGEFYPCKPDIFAATYEPVE